MRIKKKVSAAFIPLNTADRLIITFSLSQLKEEASLLSCANTREKVSFSCGYRCLSLSETSHKK